MIFGACYRPRSIECFAFSFLARLSICMTTCYKKQPLLFWLARTRPALHSDCEDKNKGILDVRSAKPDLDLTLSWVVTPMHSNRRADGP